MLNITLKNINKTDKPEKLVIASSNGEVIDLYIVKVKGNHVRIGIEEEGRKYKFKREPVPVRFLKKIGVVK